MNHNVPALGTVFSEWSTLTEQYANGMEALRRREPGASARMMEISRLMTQYQRALGEETSVPGCGSVPQVQASVPMAATRWVEVVAKVFFSMRNQGSLLFSH